MRSQPPVWITCLFHHGSEVSEKPGHDIGINRGFCPAQSCSNSIPKKHTKAYVNYEPVGLLAQAFVLTNSYTLTYNSCLC